MKFEYDGKKAINFHLDFGVGLLCEIPLKLQNVFFKSFYELIFASLRTIWPAKE